MERPFPFKIFKVTTPIDGFYYDTTNDSFTRFPDEQPFTYGNWIHSDNVMDFPPLIVSNEVRQLNKKFKLGTIYPQHEINTIILLFSTKQNACSTLNISVFCCSKSIDEISTQSWEIPLSSSV